METNVIMLSDSYKYSQPVQYPEGIDSMYDYMEARGGEYPETVWFGAQAIVKEYLCVKITKEMVEEAAWFAEMHGIPFEKEGWAYIVNELDGNIPLEIKSVDEGTLIPVKNVLMTIRSTDKKVPWIVGWAETLLMKIWYTTTIATKSYYVKQMILGYLEETGTPESIGFKYHNFGDRGSSSVESAGMGGMAHLTQFMGTDNFNALTFVKRFYPGIDGVAGFSIPASEHSTVTSWTKEFEFDMMMNHLESHKNNDLIACVMDSYDIFEAVDAITSGEFKEKIESDDYPVFVLRPDSGEPISVIKEMLDIMEDNNVAYTVNDKGYKVFNKYAIIWGDGVTPDTIEAIIQYVTYRKYSADIIAFGSGGDLMQNVNRDTCKFAIKCSNITVDGIDRDVYKDPITDPGKVSKKGKVTTYYNSNTDEYFVKEVGRDYEHSKDILKTIFKDGRMTNIERFDKIRERA